MDTKVTTTGMYRIYKKFLYEKINKHKLEVNALEKDIEKLFNLLKTKQEEIEKTKLDFNDVEYTFRNKCKLDSAKVGYLKKLDINTKTQLQHFISLAEERDKNNRLIYTLTGFYNISRELFTKILKEFNFQISKYILGSGYSYSLGFNVGSIVIREKERQTINNKTAVNWKESLLELEKIADREARHILSDYKHKLINKYKFIELMKPYTYDKNERPNAPKWIIYHEEPFSYWWYWDKNHCNIPNKTLYSFTPANYIHNPTRSQNDFLKTVKCKEDILNSTELGPRDKLQALLKFDPNHNLTYRNV